VDEGGPRHAGIVPANGESKGAVVLISSKRSEVISENGAKVSEMRGGYPSYRNQALANISGAETRATPLLLISAADGFVVFDRAGVEAFRLAAHGVVDPRATWVRFAREAPPFLAVVGMLPEQGGQWVGYEHVWMKLFIYDGGHSLVYEETLKERGNSLATMPAANGSERLLVGGEKSVWRYELRTNAKP
jgi:hypothetical protein